MLGSHARRALVAGVGVSVVAALVTIANVASAAGTTNGDAITFGKVKCTTSVGITQTQDVGAQAVVPNNVSVAASYTATIPGGTATLPSSAQGLTITGYKNLNQTYLFRPSSGTVTITAATPTSPTATNNGNSVAYNVTHTNPATFAISTGTFTAGSGGTFTITTTTAHGLAVGNVVDLTGNTPAGWNLLGAAVTTVPSSTQFTVKGQVVPISTATWNSTTKIATITTNGASFVNVGQVVDITGASPSAWNKTLTVTAVDSSSQFEASGITTSPGTLTTPGNMDTYGNPGSLSTKGSVNTLATVTLSTPTASPGTLTTPDVNVTLTAPAVDSTITTYLTGITTTATVTSLGDVAATCATPHKIPQFDGISATLAGAGGPTTSSQPTCRPVTATCDTTSTIATTSTTGGPTTSTTVGGTTTTTAATTTTTVAPTTTTTAATTTTTAATSTTSTSTTTAPTTTTTAAPTTTTSVAPTTTTGPTTTTTVPTGGNPTCDASGTIGIKPVLTLNPSTKKVNVKIKGFLGSLATPSGGCQNMSGVPSKFPISAGQFQISAQFPIGTTCTNLSTTTPVKSKITIKWKGINPKSGNLATAAADTSAIASFTQTVSPLGFMVVSLDFVKSNSVFLGKHATFNIALDQDAITLLGDCGGSGLSSLSFTGVGGPSDVEIS